MLSYFKNAFTDSPTDELTLEQYIRNIKTGFWLKFIKEVRANKDKPSYKTLKAKLPAVTVSGQFRSRDKQTSTEERLIKHSGLICIDVDRKDNPLMRVKDLVDKEALAQFVSVSGDGIKIIYRCTPTKSAAEHRRIYDAVAKRLEDKKIKLKIDPIVKSIANLQYVTYDPELYFNSKTKLIIKPLPAIKRKRVKVLEDIQQKVVQLEEYIAALDKTDVTKSYENWLLIAFGLSYSLGEAGRRLFHQLSANYKGYSQSECDEKYDSCLDRNMEGIENPVTISTVFQLINDVLPKFTIKNLTKKYSTTHTVGVGEETTEQTDLAGMVRYKLFLFKKRLNKEGGVEDLTPHAINLNELEALLKRLGFFRYGSDFVQIIHNIVEEVDSDDVLRIVTKYIEQDGDYAFAYRGLEFVFSWEELAHLWRTIRANSTTYNQITSALEHWEPQLLEDTATESFIPYRNGVVKVSAKKIELLPYSEMKMQIWKERILPREFHLVKQVGMFEEFFQNVAGRGKNQKERIKSAQYNRTLWYFGYMLQGTKRQSTARAWMLYDIRTGNNGRTGKTILGQAVGRIRNMIVLDGKRLDFTNRFAFQNVKPWTDVVFIDDPSKYMSLNPLFNMISGQLDADVKNSAPIVKSVKFMIASNWILENEGTSEIGRQFITQVDDYYVRYAKEKETVTPIVDVHGKEFFTDWDAKDWQQFDSFCMRALQFHLSTKAPEGVVINDAKVLRFIQVHEEEMFIDLCMTLAKHARELKDGSTCVPQFIMVEVVKQYNTDVKGVKAGRTVREFLAAVGCTGLNVTSASIGASGAKMVYAWKEPIKKLNLRQ